MKFYVDILGFESDRRTIEIYPTSNTWDLGVIDLYTLETSFNDITFQCNFINDIFEYYPSSDNNVWSLKTNLSYTRTGNVRLEGATLEVNDLLWIDSERIKITNVIGGGLYDIERGVNNSIAVSHFYSPNSERDFSLPRTYATLKRLTPHSLICKFYKTNNIGGEIVTLGFGVIKDIALSNNKLLTVKCEQLFKIMEKPILYDSSSRNEIIGFDSVIYPDYSAFTNEFLRLFDVLSDVEDMFYVENKYLSETTFDTKVIELKTPFYQFLQLNNSYLKFNNTTERYEMIRLEIPKITDLSIIPVFLSSYFSIKDASILVKPFQRISTIKSKLMSVTFNPSENNSVKKEEMGEIILADDVIKMTSNKNIDLNFDKIYFLNAYADINSILNLIKNKIYFLNQVFDVIEITTSRWYRKFEIGRRYTFNDSHIIKSFCQTALKNEYICLGYEDNKVTFFSYESYQRYLVPLFRDLTWNSTDSKWEVSVTNVIFSTNYTLSNNDVLRLYQYDKVSATFSESNITITNVNYVNTKYQFTISGLTYDSDVLYYVTYSNGEPTSGKKLYFLYENYGLI